MREDRIFTVAAILLLAIWAGYNLYMSYTSPSYCPMGNHGIYSYSNLLPVLLILILVISLLPRSRPQPRGDRNSRDAGAYRPSGSSDKKEVENASDGVGRNARPKDILSVIRGNPGITQDELRNITGYSASKISAEIKELELRGLIRREKYGRTYRIYPEQEGRG